MVKIQRQKDKGDTQRQKNAEGHTDTEADRQIVKVKEGDTEI